MRLCLPNNTGWAELWAWPHSLSSVTFFDIKPKRKSVVIFLSDKDKLTIVTLWHMHAEG